jgi:hypothetical protein
MLSETSVTESSLNKLHYHSAPPVSRGGNGSMLKLYFLGRNLAKFWQKKTLIIMA